MSPGRLLIGATPLGQPSDASARLVSALGSADVIAAEDTRRIRTLAQALDVRLAGKVVSLFDQNEASRVPALVDDIKGGATVLLVSDAGMPLISDPGYRLVAACIDAGLPITCLPGPSAVTTALAVSGLPSERFCFEGFAPRKHAARIAWLKTLAAEPRTCVFFESPRRLADCLRDAVEALGPERRAVVCRELTKTHEEIIRGTLAELAAGRTTACSARSPSSSRARRRGPTCRRWWPRSTRSSTTACESRTRARRWSRRIRARRRAASFTMRFCAHGH